jgi:hypothetical protein
LPLTEADPARKQTSLLLTFIMSTELNCGNIVIKKTESGKVLLVSGETFPLKDALREFGGIWNHSMKSWVFYHNDNDIDEFLDVFNLLRDAKPTTLITI